MVTHWDTSPSPGVRSCPRAASLSFQRHSLWAPPGDGLAPAPSPLWAELALSVGGGQQLSGRLRSLENPA